MNIFISTCVALLVILAGMHYMAKVKAENLGPFYKRIGYLVLLAAAFVLLGLTVKGVRKAVRQYRHADMPYSPMHYGMHGRMDGKCNMGACGMQGQGMGMGMMGKGSRMRSGGQGCGDGMGSCCCSGGMRRMNMSDSTMMEMESVIDTVDGNIIRKEIKKIRRRE